MISKSDDTWCHFERHVYNSDYSCVIYSSPVLLYRLDILRNTKTEFLSFKTTQIISYLHLILS